MLLALLIATVTVTPSLAYYHHHYHRHPWGGGCVAGACWGWDHTAATAVGVRGVVADITAWLRLLGLWPWRMVVAQLRLELLSRFLRSEGVPNKSVPPPCWRSRVPKGHPLRMSGLSHEPDVRADHFSVGSWKPKRTCLRLIEPLSLRSSVWSEPGHYFPC
jgi:hypothetical protein